VDDLLIHHPLSIVGIGYQIHISIGGAFLGHFPLLLILLQQEKQRQQQQEHVYTPFEGKYVQLCV